MKRVVVTGGPGGGKAAFLALARRELCEHVAILPDAAFLLAKGGFPEPSGPDEERARVRATFHVQRELEVFHTETSSDTSELTLCLCHRGTLDGVVRHPFGERGFLEDLALDREAELARYACVLHLRSPRQGDARMREIDARIAEAWRGHPHRRLIERRIDFLNQVQDALRVVYALLPEACRRHECVIGAASCSLHSNVFALRR
jgi:hypothetical protein